ncbi:MAG: GyrI-like domain-containing protein [Armatimonadota bacterium]
MTTTETIPSTADFAAAPARFETGNGMTLAGFQQRYSFENASEIPALWARFGPLIDTVPAMVGTIAYGVVHEESEGSIDYLAGVEVSETDALSSEYTTLAIPAQRYAVFAHPGHISTLCQTVDAAFSKWLPSSGFEATANPDFFERYGDGYDPETGTGDIEIWVPIRG